MSDNSIDGSEYQKFFEEVAKGNAEKMAFKVTKTNPEEGASFSFDAIDKLTFNVRAFVLARVASEWRRTGKPPTHLRLNAGVSFTEYPDDLEIDPWWSVGDSGTDTFDGKYRESGLKKLSREGD